MGNFAVAEGNAKTNSVSCKLNIVLLVAICIYSPFIVRGYAKYDDNNIIEGKYDDSNIIGRKYAENNIIGGKYADNNIIGGKYADNNIIGGKYANNTIIGGTL